MQPMYGKEENKMKTIVMLLAAVMIFAGCSARQEDMMSNVESSVSSVLEPDKSSSSQSSQSSSAASSNSSAASSNSSMNSESEPILESDTDRAMR